MQHPGIDTAFPDPWQGREEQIVSFHVPLMTWTMVSHSFGIPSSKGNPLSSVQASGIGNTLFALTG